MEDSCSSFHIYQAAPHPAQGAHSLSPGHCPERPHVPHDSLFSYVVVFFFSFIVNIQYYSLFSS